MGCIGAIVATVAIALLPLVARWTALSSTALWGIGIALGVTLLGGGLLVSPSQASVPRRANGSSAAAA